MTLFCKLCSLRQREVRRANRLSNNCTFVVTMSGASQFSHAKRERAVSRPSALSALLWCSTTMSPNPCAANGANEAAVAHFLRDEIGFLDIGRLVEGVVDSDSFGGDYTLADVHECDRMARAYVEAHI